MTSVIVWPKIRSSLVYRWGSQQGRFQQPASGKPENMQILTVRQRRKATTTETLGKLQVRHKAGVTPIFTELLPMPRTAVCSIKEMNQRKEKRKEKKRTPHIHTSLAKDIIFLVGKGGRGWTSKTNTDLLKYNVFYVGDI